MWPFRRRPAAPSVPTPELVRLREEVKKKCEVLETAYSTNCRLMDELSSEKNAHLATQRLVRLLRQQGEEQARDLAFALKTVEHIRATQQRQPRDAAGRFVRVAP